jgi:hypothetical protein
VRRRDFLRMLGGTGALWAPSLFVPCIARASSSPKRLFVFFSYHGCVYDRWTMRGLGSPSGADLPSTSWAKALPTKVRDWTHGLAPLHDFQSRATIIDGLALISAEADVNSAGRRHETAAAHALTGAMSQTVADLPIGTAQSLDQAIAQAQSLRGQYTSLEWAVGAPNNSPFYADSHIPLPGEANPSAAVTRLRGHGNSVATSTQAQEMVLRALENRYSAAGRALSSADHSKLSLHMDLLSDMRERLSGLEKIRSSCPSGPSTAHAGMDASSLYAQRGSPEVYEADMAAFTHLIGTAFSCDFTRVISLNADALPMQSLSGEVGNVHNDYAHNILSNDFAAEMIDLHYRLNAAHFAQIGSLLESIVDPLGDGAQSILDNTLMLWVNELGDGTHSFERWPVVLLGGDAFTGFQMGQYLYHPSDQPLAGWHESGENLVAMAQPHQLLLTSIAQAFDLHTDCFGIPEVRGTDNARIDCSGTLPGLL